VLRVAVWREVAAQRRADPRRRSQQVFGIIVSGSSKSIDGKALCRLGPSEAGWRGGLPASVQRAAHATAVTLEPTLFLEINAAALALSSEELLERMRNVLLAG
jgi:hypothetical protein